jgi:hypothetical protein
MKVITLDNLRELLGLMGGAFGNRELSIDHRTALNTYILNINNEWYENNLEFDTNIDITESNSSSVLGFGVLGIMTLGASYAAATPVLGDGELGIMIL